MRLNFYLNLRIHIITGLWQVVLTATTHKLEDKGEHSLCYQQSNKQPSSSGLHNRTHVFYISSQEQADCCQDVAQQARYSVEPVEEESFTRCWVWSDHANDNLDDGKDHESDAKSCMEQVMLKITSM